MSQEFKGYAATKPGGPLEPFSFDPGPLGPEEVEIKVTHCGLCHSDLSMLDNDWGMTKYPFVPGHEVTGTVRSRRRSQRTHHRTARGTWMVVAKLPLLPTMFVR